MTIRLSAGLAEELDLAAEVDGVPAIEVIRTALAEHIQARKADPDFQARLRARIERAQRMLDHPSPPRPG